MSTRAVAAIDDGPTTIEDIYTKLVLIHEDIRDVSKRLTTIESRLFDLESERSNAERLRDEQDHIDSVRARGMRRCTSDCEVCRKADGG